MKTNMPAPMRVLLVAQDEHMRDLLDDVVTRHIGSVQFSRAEGGNEAMAIVEDAIRSGKRIDLILATEFLTKGSAEGMLSRLLTLQVKIPVIMLMKSSTPIKSPWAEAVNVWVPPHFSISDLECAIDRVFQEAPTRPDIDIAALLGTNC